MKVLKVSLERLDMSDRRDGDALRELQVAALAAAANAVVITETDGSVVWANHAFTRMTGYDLADLRGRTLQCLKSGIHGPAFYRAMWKTVLAGDVWSGELVNQRKDGTLYHEAQTITPVRDARGVITHFIAVKQDITAVVRERELLMEETKLAECDRMAAEIAHELANAVMVAGCRLQLLQREGGEAVIKHAASLREAIERMQQITASLLPDARRSQRGQPAAAVAATAADDWA